MRKRILLLALIAIVLISVIVLAITRSNTTAPIASKPSASQPAESTPEVHATPTAVPATVTHEAPRGFVVQKPASTALPQGYQHSVDAVKKTETASDHNTLQGIDKLIDAINKEDVAGVKAAVGKGTSVNARDADGHTPLTTAAYGGNLEIVAYLIAQKAEVNATNSSGETPLFEAVKNIDEDGAVAVSKVLIAHGADVTVKCNGVSPLELAIGNQSEKLVALLKNAGAQ
jgi:hypothetical protein